MTSDQLLEQTFQRASIDKQSQDNITLGIQWLNLVINDISGRYTWPWLHSRTPVTTIVDTEGTSAITVAATLANTTVTGTGTTFASTDVNRFIQFSSSKDWYKITAVASATSLTLETGYALATESGMDFIIRTFSYDLPSDCHKVYDVRQFRSPKKLVWIDTQMFDTLRPDQTGVGQPRAYYTYVYSNPQSVTGQQWAISFDPIPDAAQIIEVRYLKRPVALTNGTNIPEIPTMYHNVILDGLTYQAFLWANNPNTGGMKDEYEKGIIRMKKDMPQTVDNFHVLQPCDEQGASSGPIPFPSQYGYPYSR